MFVSKRKNTRHRINLKVQQKEKKNYSTLFMKNNEHDTKEKMKN